MFIKVKLFSGFPEPLLYQVPDDCTKAVHIGSIVKVPVRQSVNSGIVTELIKEQPEVNFSIKKALQVETFPEDPHYLVFIQKLAHYYQIDFVQLLKRIKSFFKAKIDTVAQEMQETNQQEILLTSEQQAVVEYLSPFIKKPIFVPTVLHGVTGSGKTQVYKKLIQEAFLHNKITVLLLPEVTLAVQFETILRQLLPADLPIFGFHSATGAKTKKQLWSYLLEQKSCLIIGVHLPILLPLPNLGLIIVDEEHEVGYQEKKHPKINSKEAAIWRAQQSGIPIVLGSATPALTTLHNVKTRGWKLFELTQRFAGAFPEIKYAQLLDKKKRQNFWITDLLLTKLKEQLEKKEQTILFLNRRGVSFFVQCKNCSFVFCCNTCSVSLTLHADNSLRCHYCQYQIQQPKQCPQCHDIEFIKKGIGTQQLVTILEKLIPQARIARADMDSTVNRTLWQKTVEDFKNQKLDILVGTQTITKGYHFPQVTLVGIMWADLNLSFPQYNAQETTLQQLIQVAGRAGRYHTQSTVVIQAMADHPVFQFMNEKEYKRFYTQEILNRQEVGYPPCKRFAEIELKHKKEEIVEQEAHRLVLSLFSNKTITVLGPTQPPVAKIKNIVSRKIYLKADAITSLIQAYQAIDKKQFKSSLFFTPNPL